jgi:hypothetical protein
MRKPPKIGIKDEKLKGKIEDAFIARGGDSPVEDSNKATRGITLRLSGVELRAVKTLAGNEERSIQYILRRCVQRGIENGTSSQ